MFPSELLNLQNRILAYEQRGLVTRTFRRLDPDRQEAIIHSILAEAAQHGPANLNVKRVAEGAGVSVGSIYQYFGSRDGLLAFSIELVVDSMTDLFEQARFYLSQMPLSESLGAYIQGGVEWSQAQEGSLQFFARAAYHGDPELRATVVDPIAAEMLATTREMISQAQARGELRPDIDLEAAARLVHALTVVIGDAVLLPHLNAYFQITAPDMPLERVFTALIDLLKRGLAASDQSEDQQ
jgi:AcrR family transcriptional regulator